jgi:hypothetical protein
VEEAVGSSAEDRVAASQARFREANEELRGRYVDLVADGALPFICECSDQRCTRVVSLTLDEYGEVRADAGRLLIVPGHELADSERVVDETDRFAVVVKRAAPTA